MADDAQGSIDELYGLDPNDFVAARNALAKSLRKAGDRQLATEVSTLRRPTPAAWAINQLARRHRGDVKELVRLGEVLRAAQDEALGGGPERPPERGGGPERPPERGGGPERPSESERGGGPERPPERGGAGPGDLRRAGRARRDAVARLAEQAEAIMAERGGVAGTYAGEITATLEAASLDAGAAEEVLAGRLTAELRPPSGFGVFDLPVAEARRPAKPEPEGHATPDEPEDTGPSEREITKAEEAAAEARHRWDEWSEKARAAVGRVEHSRRDVADAEAEVSRLEELLSEAQRRLRGAVRNAELAEDAASRAEDAAARAGEAQREAEQRLAALTDG